MRESARRPQLHLFLTPHFTLLAPVSCPEHHTIGNILYGDNYVETLNVLLDISLYSPPKAVSTKSVRVTVFDCKQCGIYRLSL